MDERLQFGGSPASRRGKWRISAGSLGSRARPATKSSVANSEAAPIHFPKSPVFWITSK